MHPLLSSLCNVKDVLCILSGTDENLQQFLLKIYSFHPSMAFLLEIGLTTRTISTRNDQSFTPVLGDLHQNISAA